MQKMAPTLSTFLWTRDKRLRSVAEGLGIHGIRHTDYPSTRERLASFGLSCAEKMSYGAC